MGPCRMGGIGIPLDAEQEMRRNQNRLQRQANPVRKGLSFPFRRRSQTNQRIDLLGPHRPAIGAR